jgi:hypothetical protein
LTSIPILRAVPAIMAARTIESKRDRIATILIAPFMTCSARLPVYTLIIAAFIPDRPLLGAAPIDRILIGQFRGWLQPLPIPNNYYRHESQQSAHRVEVVDIGALSQMSLLRKMYQRYNFRFNTS